MLSFESFLTIARLAVAGLALLAGLSADLFPAPPGAGSRLTPPTPTPRMVAPNPTATTRVTVRVVPYGTPDAIYADQLQRAAEATALPATPSPG